MNQSLKSLFAASFLFLFLVGCPILALATEQPPAASQKNPSSYYYILDLYYDKSQNQLTLNTQTKNDLPISLEPYDFTHDVGAGSQFYAQVLDANGQPQAFSSGDTKYFLGKWELNVMWDGLDKEGKPVSGTKELTKGTVKVSVPYFPEGQYLNIHQSSDDQLMLSVNVSAFSQKGQEEYQAAVATAREQIAKEQAAPAQKSKLIWVVIAVFALALAAIGAIIWIRKARQA